MYEACAILSLVLCLWSSSKVFPNILGVIYYVGKPIISYYIYYYNIPIFSINIISIDTVIGLYNQLFGIKINQSIILLFQ